MQARRLISEIPAPSHLVLNMAKSMADIRVTVPLVVSVKNDLGEAMAGLNVYAFNGETYTGYSKVSDENGLAIFNLPLGDYRFRADSGGTQFWSAATNSCTLPGCESAVVTVTPPVTLTVVDTDGLAQAGLNVYAFNGATSTPEWVYTGFSKVTDPNGQAVFILPAGEYRFRADIPSSTGAGGGTQFWSSTENACTLPGCTTAAVTVTKPVTVTVAGEAENPYVGLTVYAFDGSTYSGYSAVTDAGGKVVFTLPLGSYRFRADYDGVEFWSGNENTCTLPTCISDKVTLPGGTGMQEVSIDYTYDALNRLTSATYSNGRAALPERSEGSTKFAYTYDAAGNVLTYAATHYGLTTTTTYTYDEANQLLSAVDSSTAWQYTYDGNGSLLQSDPGTDAANGSTRYTYNTAGYLVKLETHNGTDWQTQSEMKYDGLGNRLEMTTYVDGTPGTTRYQLDNGQTLAAKVGEMSTFTLYGRGVIGTFSTEWSYILQDGAGSMRQLAKPDGAVALSVSYTPWGDTLEVYGTGMLDIGYLGGVYDAGTGLIYMGNGQYYDPSTGRFLTRGAKPDQSNPYTPWNNDPSGMLIAPLALLALVFGRKKNRTKLDHFVILVVIGLSVGLSVSACGGGGTPTIQPIASPTMTPVPTAPNNPNADVQPYTEKGKMNETGEVVATTPVPQCDVTPIMTITPTLVPPISGRSIYWRGMSSAQLGAYQKDQGTRNDCALYAIAAALNLLGNPTTPFDGNKIALDVDNQWRAGKISLRFWPNQATFPYNQINVINYLNQQNSSTYGPSYVIGTKGYMRNALSDNDKLLLVTLYFHILNPPIFLYGQSQLPVEMGWLPANGHTMVLVAHDQTNIDPNTREVYEWGFINSWRIGGEIYWLRDKDVYRRDVVEVRK
jgi:RHS repeat-associated protein